MHTDMQVNLLDPEYKLEPLDEFGKDRLLPLFLI